MQERGIDEADIIKTDGRRIFTLSQGRLVLVDARQRRVTGSAEVADGWSSEMFLGGDTLLLVVRSNDSNGRGEHSPETVLQRIRPPKRAHLAPRLPHCHLTLLPGRAHQPPPS